MPRLLKRAGVKGFKNYLIYYQIQGEIIDVMHVFQGARNISAILQQEIDEETLE